MRRLITEELSKKDQRIENAIFSVCSPEEVFNCILCQGKFEKDLDLQYEIKGNFIGKDINKKVHISLCESCSLDLGLLETEVY